MFGYDAGNISPQVIEVLIPVISNGHCRHVATKWLGDVRLVAHQILDAERFTEKDSADLPMVSPLVRPSTYCLTYETNRLVYRGNMLIPSPGTSSIHARTAKIPGRIS